RTPPAPNWTISPTCSTARSRRWATPTGSRRLRWPRPPRNPPAAGAWSGPEPGPAARRRTALEHHPQGQRPARRRVLALDLERVHHVRPLVLHDLRTAVAVEPGLGLHAVGVEQVVAGQAQHHVVVQALLEEHLEVAVVQLALDLAVGDEARLALLLVAEPEARLDRRKVLGHADVVDVGRLVVDADVAATRGIGALGPQAGVVGEHAGLLEPEHVQRRGQVQFGTMGPGNELRKA